MEIPSQAVKSLMEIGIVAAGSGLRDHARAIFEGLAAVRPESDGPAIGLALIDLGRSEHEAAIGRLREAVAQHPESLDSKMFLGLALKLAGRNAECGRVVEELVASGDARAKAFAAGLTAQ
jgi:hypothetical protein